MGEGTPSTATSPSPSDRPKRLRGRRAWPGIGAILAVALAAGFVAWVLLERNDSEPSPTTSAPTAVNRGRGRPSIATVAELQAAAAASRTPFYWVGPRGQTQLELTRAPAGQIFIRYLPTDKRAGDLQPFLTIATYPRRNAFREVRAASRNSESRTIRLAGGGIAVYDPDKPMNVHLAYPGQAYQIEVFSPEGGVARELVSNGAVRPVG